MALATDSNKRGAAEFRILGIPANPRRGGVSKNIVYVVFPGSGNGNSRTLAEIEREGTVRFAAWDGQPQLDACLP